MTASTTARKTKMTTNSPTRPKTTCDGTTSRERHRATLVELRDWLDVTGEDNRQTEQYSKSSRSRLPIRDPMGSDLGQKMGEWFASVRWAIEREKTRIETMSDEPLYRVHHRLSVYRGRIVRLRVRPSTKCRPNNVLAECVDNGQRFVCPWRGLRRVRS